MSMYLNPNLSLEDIRKLKKLQLDGVNDLIAAFEKSMASLPDQKTKMEYFNQMYPIIVQETIMLFF